MTYIHMLWSAPLQISLSMLLLWNVLGPSSLAGLGVMVVMIPLNGYIARKTRKLQVQQMAQKDSRIKEMNEVWFSWERKRLESGVWTDHPYCSGFEWNQSHQVICLGKSLFCCYSKGLVNYFAFDYRCQIVLSLDSRWRAGAQPEIWIPQCGVDFFLELSPFSCFFSNIHRIHNQWKRSHTNHGWFLNEFKVSIS